MNRKSNWFLGAMISLVGLSTGCVNRDAGLPTALKHSEADVGITLPEAVPPSRKPADEQIINVKANGSVVLNNRDFGNGGATELPELVAILTRYKAAMVAGGMIAMITLRADSDVRHERVVEVMNACAEAGIKHVTLSLSDDE